MRIRNAVFSMFVAIHASCSTSSEENYPHLEVALDVVDLGKIESLKGGSLEGFFSIINRGSAPLKIFQKRVSCGCTISEWPTDEVPPNSSMKIRLHVNPRYEDGEQSSVLTFLSNDPVTPKKDIKILWRELPPISFSPHSVRFDSLEDSKEGTSIVKAHFAAPTLRDSLDVVSLSSYLSARWAPTSPRGNESEASSTSELVVTISRDRPSGDGSSEVRVQGKGGEIYSRLPVTWSSAAAIEASPSAIYHSNVKFGDKIPCRVLLRHISNTHFNIRSFQINGKEVDYQDDETPSSDTAAKWLRFEIVVTRDSPGIEERTLKVVIDEPNRNQVEVPIRLFVK